MKLTIEIDLGNAAFEDSNFEEITRILNDKRILNDSRMVENSNGLYHCFQDSILDINGNKVGFYRID